MTLVFTGWVLVLVSWVVLVGIILLVGTPLSALTHDGRVSARDVRRGLWWGFTIYAIVVMLISPFTALTAPVAAGVALALPITGACVLSILVHKRGWCAGPVTSRTSVFFVGALLSAISYLGLAALGPVTNYDTGLYHLGSVAYAENYPTVPGLANVYFPFGYSSVEFPLAALLSNGPWSGNGYRLLNGLFIVALAIDVLLRWISRTRGADSFIMLVSGCAVLLPMIFLSDYWVTSPSQDLPVFILTVACVTSLVSAATRAFQWRSELASALALSVLLVLMRPTTVAFSVGALVVIWIIWQRRASVREQTGHLTKVLMAGTVVVGAVALALRDYLLSGWLGYPVSLVAFDVDWLAPDPTGFREATLGFHRNPQDLWVAVDSWTWVVPWIQRLPEQWEFWFLVLLSTMLLVSVITVQRRRSQASFRVLLLVLLPSVLGAVFWFIASPPAFRFAWGPVFTLVTIPTGWFLWQIHAGTRKDPSSLSGTPLILGAAVSVLGVTLYSLVFRFDVRSVTERNLWTLGIEVPYMVTPTMVPATQSYFVSDSFVVQVPVGGDQCWSVFPLCAGQLPEPTEMRGNAIKDGFRQSKE